VFLLILEFIKVIVCIFIFRFQHFVFNILFSTFCFNIFVFNFDCFLFGDLYILLDAFAAFLLALRNKTFN